jgi:hypothetical protein
MSKHTRGPWRITSFPEANPHQGDWWCYAFDKKPNRHNTFAEHEANARIMSAAPDMLEALQAIIVASDTETTLAHTAVENIEAALELVRAAVTKATGALQ